MTEHFTSTYRVLDLIPGSEKKILKMGEATSKPLHPVSHHHKIGSGSSITVYQRLWLGWRGRHISTF